MFLAYLYLFLFQGESLFLIGWSLWSCLDCIQVLHFVLYLFSSCHICFTLLDYSGQGGIFFMFLVSNCLLIYVYEFFIDICLYCVLFEIMILFSLLLFFPHMRLCILFKCFRNIQVDSIKLLSTLATDGQQIGLNLCL